MSASKPEADDEEEDVERKTVPENKLTLENQAKVF